MTPLDNLLTWFPRSDFMVLRHGYSPDCRDYHLEVQTNLGQKPGTHLLAFTHTVHSVTETELGESTWKQSWSNEFSNYDAWVEAGEPDGFVWGRWPALAYPGLYEQEQSEDAARWSEQLDRQMSCVALYTDLFRLTLVFFDIQATSLSDETEPASSVVHLLDGERDKPR